MMDWLALLSLIFLFLAIVIGFTTRINTGIVAIGLALILGKISGITEAEIIKGFNYSLFITLTGVTFLFSIAQTNGTLDLLARKVIALCGKRSYIIPIAVFLLAVVLSAIGPGTIPVSALMAVLTVALALQMNIPPIKLAAFGLLGACAGGFSSIAPTGIIAITYAKASGIGGLELPLLLGLCIGMGSYAIILYIAFKWYAVKAEAPIARTETGKFTHQQLITLGGIVLMTVLTLFFEINVGLSAFLAIIILLLFRVTDEKEAFNNIPLSTLILVTGVGMLMNLVLLLGGIDMLSGMLASLMTKNTAPALFSLSGGILSWFSSTSGVVLPTLIPTIPYIVEHVEGVRGAEMVISLSNGAHAASLSPLSTLGALVLAAYTALVKPDAKERNKMFGGMFIISIIGVLFVSLLALMGVFNLVLPS